MVWENQPVTVRFVTEEEAAALPLRKEPARTGQLRLVEIDGFDLSACGGTHVPETGRIGVIAVAGWERFKGATRLTFVCGGRALRSHGRLRDVVAGATRALSVAAADLPAAIERLQAEIKDAGRAARRLQEELAVARAAEFRGVGGDHRALSRRLKGHPGLGCRRAQDTRGGHRERARVRRRAGRGRIAGSRGRNAVGGCRDRRWAPG